MLRNRTRQNVVAFARPNYIAGQLNKVLALANGEVGIAEYPPNSNNVKYNTWYYGHPVSGASYPWCAVFISWLFDNFTTVQPNPAVPTIHNKPTIKKGAKGEFVELLQELLIVKGYILKIDGSYTYGRDKNWKEKRLNCVSVLNRVLRDMGVIGENDEVYNRKKVGKNGEITHGVNCEKKLKNSNMTSMDGNNKKASELISKNKLKPVKQIKTFTVYDSLVFPCSSKSPFNIPLSSSSRVMYRW